MGWVAVLRERQLYSGSDGALLMSGDEQQPAKRTRRVISATCAVHPGTPRFTNLEVTWDGEHLSLRPHATGACVLQLNEAEASELYVFIEEMLGEAMLG